MDEEDLVERLSTVSAMEALIQENLPGLLQICLMSGYRSFLVYLVIFLMLSFTGCSLRLYGSSCSRMGFKNSDLNIDIQFPASVSVLLGV